MSLDKQTFVDVTFLNIFIDGLTEYLEDGKRVSVKSKDRFRSGDILYREHEVTTYKVDFETQLQEESIVWFRKLWLQLRRLSIPTFPVEVEKRKEVVLVCKFKDNSDIRANDLYVRMDVHDTTLYADIIQIVNGYLSIMDEDYRKKDVKVTLIKTLGDFNHREQDQAKDQVDEIRNQVQVRE